MVTLRKFRQSDSAWITARHGALYARDEGFDDSFAPLVGSILEDFVANHDPKVERGWVAEKNGERLGCIFCVRLDDDTAKLRLFLIEPGARGLGLGRMLLETCIGFAKDTGYREMTLWTHESHQAACALYTKFGFRCTSSKPVHSFGQNLIEQVWQIDL